MLRPQPGARMVLERQGEYRLVPETHHSRGRGQYKPVLFVQTTPVPPAAKLLEIEIQHYPKQKSQYTIRVLWYFTYPETLRSLIEWSFIVSTNGHYRFGN
eukprot:3401501-Rhodomonas_salina.2